MKSRSNIEQVASVAESKSRLIEGTVIKVYPQTRMAQVRLDGSSQYTQINLGAIDPSLVSTAGSRVLLYDANGILYAVSVIPGQHAKSSPGITLGDSGAGTRFSVYNAQNTEVASINSAGNIGYSGDLEPTRDSVKYTGSVLVPIAEPLTNSSFNGDSFSTVSSNTKIENTSWSTTIPADATALLIRALCRDSASSSTTDLWFSIYGSSSATVGSVTTRLYEITNNQFADAYGPAPCTSGDIWYRCNASGSGTLDVWLWCFGYFL